MFDITQGRSTGMQVQAISRSGTNTIAGSVYGFFRERQVQRGRPGRQARAAVLRTSRSAARSAGRSCRDKMHYFGSYEYEREPGTVFTQPVAAAGPDLHARRQERAEELPGARRRSARRATTAVGSRIALGPGTTRSFSAARRIRRMPECRRKDATNVLGTWSRVLGEQQQGAWKCRVGYNNFDWTNDAAARDGRRHRSSTSPA